MCGGIRANQLFNSLTYEWISANLKAGAMPIRQASGSTFTNLATNALASVSYSLSTGDQTKLRGGERSHCQDAGASTRRVEGRIR